MVLDQIRDRLKELAAKRQLSEFSRKADISLRMLNDLIADRRSPGYDSIEAIATALGYDVVMKPKPFVFPDCGYKTMDEDATPCVSPVDMVIAELRQKCERDHA